MLVCLGVDGVAAETLCQPTLWITCTFWKKVITCMKCWIIHCYHVQHVVHVMLCRCYVVHVHVIECVLFQGVQGGMYLLITEKVLQY